jgi:hypothetical protein
MTEQQIPSQPAVQLDLSALPPDARILALYEAYPSAKAEADEAARRLKDITDGIKFELGTAAPGVDKIELRGPHGTPLRYARQITRRFNTKRFQREQAEVYESYREPSESWVLAPIKAGE